MDETGDGAEKSNMSPRPLDEVLTAAGARLGAGLGAGADIGDVAVSKSPKPLEALKPLCALGRAWVGA